MTFLITYWLEGLLAVSGLVTVIGLLVNQMRIKHLISVIDDDCYRNKRRINEFEAWREKPRNWFLQANSGLKDANLRISANDDDIQNLMIHRMAANQFMQNSTKDFSELKSRLDLLDKPSNDKAIENIAVILKKKILKKSIPTKSIAGSKLKKANGARHAIR